MEPVRPLPGGTVTFLFTDIEGSTRLLRELGDAYRDLLEAHHRVLRAAVEAAGGVPVSTEGDALFAVFDSARRATSAVLRAQRELAAREWPGGANVRVRMGLHSGEGTHGGDNYVGIDVHRAARIAAAAHGGQVLVSEATRSLVLGSLADGELRDVDLRDLGEHRLKDLARPEHLYQVVAAGLPADFPPLRTLDLTPNNLPTQLTSFVGRGGEVAHTRRLLASARLLTLTGPGGTGKSRLALQLAAETAAEYPDGAFFVPLAPVREPSLVASAIAQALGVQDAGNRSLAERLAEFVRDRRILLVLDNFEQLLPAGSLVVDLLRAGPGLRVVVTSRAALRVSGEQEFPVPPLGVPDTRHLPALSSLSQYEAVALFIERASAVKPDFGVTNENAPAVAEICARLDGLPLAIELAAARIKLLPPQAMLSRLGSRLGLLAGGSRDLPARQQTLRGAIEWSYDLLDAAARRLFARLAVFAGGCTLDAAEAVCGPGLEVDVLDGLAGLVDQSLLRQDEPDGQARFAMLGTIREFALERLAGSGESDEVSRRHASAYLALMQEAAPALTGPDQRAWLDRLDREEDNVRAALAWTIERGEAGTGLRLAAAFWRFWHMRGQLREGAEWLDRLLAMPEGRELTEERAGALEAAGGVAYWRGDMDAATRHYEACLAICRSIGDERRIANALYNAAFPHLVDRSDVRRSERLLQESLAISRRLDDRPAIARTLWALGNAHYYTDEFGAARDLFVECIAMLRVQDDIFSLAWALHSLGLAYRRLGVPRMAAPVWREALERFAQARDVSGVALVLGDLSSLALDCGDPERAVRLAGASAQLVDSGGFDLGALISEIEGRDVAKAGSLGSAEIAALLAAGRAMSADQATAYALEWVAGIREEE